MEQLCKKKFCNFYENVLVNINPESQSCTCTRLWSGSICFRKKKNVKNSSTDVKEAPA